MTAEVAVYGQVADVYESPTNNYRVTLPPGWVIEDKTQIGLDRGTALLQSIHGFEDIGTICTEENALPAIGGLSECRRPEGGEQLTSQTAQDADIRIYRFSELQSRPEFAVLLDQGGNITARDMIPLQIQLMRSISEAANPTGTRLNLDLLSQQETSVRVSNSDNMTVPAIFAELGSSLVGETLSGGTITGTDTKMFGLFLVSPDQDTGYVLLSARWSPNMTLQQLPPEIMQIMQSFELVSVPTTAAAPNTTVQR